MDKYTPNGGQHDNIHTSRFIATGLMAIAAFGAPLSAAHAGAPSDAPLIQAEAPAPKVGVARVVNGHIAIAPYAELEAWAHLKWRLDLAEADIRMISPVAVAQVSEYSVAELGLAENPTDLIRLAAARAGLDYVILYDTGNGTQSTALARTSFTKMGITGWEAPDTDGRQNAKVLLVSVNDGYLRGTSEISVDTSTITGIMAAASALIDGLNGKLLDTQAL